MRPLSPKITRTKWTGGVAQAVERLLCKLEVLSLKNKNKKQSRRRGKKPKRNTTPNKS
jgi:hypothetical protein